MTTRRGFLGVLAALHCKLGGVSAATNSISLPKPLPTVLSAQADTLEPGKWVKLPPARNQGPCLTQVDRWLTSYSNQAAWDPTRKLAHYCGKRQSRYPIQHAIYREATHDWIKQWDDLLVPLGTFGHGYGYNIINPATGRVFFKNHDVPRKVYYADPPNYSWSTNNVLPDWPNSGGGNVPAQPCFFWTGLITGAGDQGLIGLFVNGSGDASMHFVLYDVQSGQWLPSVVIEGTNSAFERWGDYSAVHNCAVCFANDGNTSYDRPYRLDSDKSVTRLANSPRLTGALRANFIADPVTGNFLMMATDGTFWDLDPTGSGQWAQLARAPSELWPLTKIGTICWGIPAYGVTVWATHKGDMWLYKHRLRAQVPGR
jgi:hypothetical protein